MAIIIFKNNETAGAAPATDDLQKGEPAFNLADNILFTKDKDGSIKRWKSSEHYDFAEQTLTPISNQATISFSQNRFFNEIEIESNLTINVAASGNVPGNKVFCTITPAGEESSQVILPSVFKIVQGSFSTSTGTKNLFEFQYFSNIIITKIYQIP